MNSGNRKLPALCVSNGTEENAAMDPESGQCFICRCPANSTSFAGQKEWAAFELLCDLLDMPWARNLDVLKPKNSNFCEPCELQIQDAVKIQNEIKSLNLELVRRKFDLHKSITRSYQRTSDADRKSDRSSLLTLGRMLSQCWSRCEVVLDHMNVRKSNLEQEIMIATEYHEVQVDAKWEEESDGDPDESNVLLDDPEWCPSEESEVDKEATNATSNLMRIDDETAANAQTSGSPCPSDGPSKRKRRQRTKCSRRSKIKDLSNPKFACKDCGKSFDAQSKLRFHRLRHHNKQRECEICEAGKFYDYIKLKAHLRRHGGDPVYACDTCDQAQFFRTASAVRQHYSDHHPDSTVVNFTCSTCRHSCPTPAELFSHQKLSHPVPNTKDYLCQDCGKSYSHLYNLIAHQKFRHLGIPRKRKSLQCDQCGKIFPEMNKLKFHVLDVHERGARTCPICKRSCQAVTHLKSHIKQAHGEDWKDWIDSYTGEWLKEGPEAGELKGNYNCNVCNKVMPSEIRLRRHVREIHNSEPVTCPICFKKFRNKHQARNHVRLTHHQDPKPWFQPKTGEPIFRNGPPPEEEMDSLKND